MNYLRNEEARRAKSARNRRFAGEHIGEPLGETTSTKAGYVVRVEKVDFEEQGGRIRIKLYQNDTFVRHIDITTRLAIELGGILSKLV